MLCLQLTAGAAFARSSACVGDCDGSRTVTIDELVHCVDAALDQGQLAGCAACDQDEDGGVNIDELVRGVLIALGASVRVDGTCSVPGSEGLEPCAPGTGLQVTRCDDGTTCFDGGGEAIDFGCVGANPDNCVDAQGRFIIESHDCRAVGAALVLSADVDPDPQAETLYRAVGFGAASETAEIPISPMSEAAVAIIADLDVVTLTPENTLPLVLAVRDADAGIDYSILDFGAAAVESRDVAAEDPCVQFIIIDLGPVGHPAGLVTLCPL